MPPIKRFDHIGITVADLDAVTAFFVGLGLEVDGRVFVEGEFVEGGDVPRSGNAAIRLIPGVAARRVIPRFGRGRPRYAASGPV